MCRAAVAADAGQLAVLDSMASPHPRPAAHWPRLLCSPDTNAALQRRVLVACEGDFPEPVGFLVWSIVLDEATIEDIAVLPRFRNQGCATAQLGHAFGVMRELGVRRCLLEVRQGNAPARALYEHCGFRVDGKRQGYYDNGGEAAVLMSKELRS